MDIQALAMQASDIMSEIAGSRYLRDTHGIEVSKGFFNLYNDYTGQSKIVLYHPESGYVFKETWENVPVSASGRYLGDVLLEGLTFPVRLPHFFVFPLPNNTEYFAGITAQEYVQGDHCGCHRSFCDHAEEVRRATGCHDTHIGNWKIVGEEIVLFDFEGMNLH